MSRPIRNDRARELQGSRAGITSRALASAMDVGIGFLLYAAFVFAVSLVWDLFFSKRFDTPTPPAWLSALGTWITVTLYLAIGWGSTGRTIGKQVMGLRVVRADAEPLKPRQALGRAVLCASFYPGLALAAVHKRNRALEDLVFRTVVVYDWIPEASHPGPAARSGRHPSPSSVSGEQGA